MNSNKNQKRIMFLFYHDNTKLDTSKQMMSMSMLEIE